MSIAVAEPAPSRDDVMRLGSAGRPWEFLLSGFEAIRADPEDVDLRLMLAANAIMLGLKTLAQEQLEHVPPRKLKRSDVALMRSKLEALAPDEYPRNERLATLRANVEALATRGVHLGPILEAWIEADAERRWFRAHDANMPRRRGESWEMLDDQAGHARRLAQTHLNGGEWPVTIEGLDPPWLLTSIISATPVALGYRPRITIVQADPMELLDGLAHVDLTEALTDERVHVLVGEDAADRLAQDLRDRFETQISGPVATAPSLRTRLAPPAEAVVAQAEADQKAEHAQLLRVVRSMYDGRDRSWWAARFAAARDGTAEPLRVLVPTCRYSTFIQHSATDLVSAFRSAGCTAELLIEPDDSSRVSSLAYLRAIERLAPDLVMLINYTRTNLGELFPPELPFVCWMQDAMGHHYDAAVGARQTEMDFLVGHLAEELFDQFRYPRERTMKMPVVTNERKFHAGPVKPGVARRYECEIAWVSHHSEDPAAMHERLKSEIGPELAVLLDALQPAVERIARGPLDFRAEAALRKATAEAVEKRRGRVEPEVATQILMLYARPLADRIMRHQTLEWAANIADRRSWRLRVHGRGWESHPRFSRYAAGPVTHDDELRACYQSANVHLHMTYNNIVHQRIMECALSGGLPLCRLSGESILPIVRAYTMACVQGEPVERDDSGEETLLGFASDGTPEAAALYAMLLDVGADLTPIKWIRARKAQQYRAAAPPAQERRADWLLGDLRETTFSSPQRLESLVERAIEDADWRRSTSASIAARVRERLTDDVLVSRVLKLVTTSLGGGA